MASAGKIKGLRGAKLGNPYLRWAFGEAAIIAKRDHQIIGPLAQRLEVKMNGNKFKANTIVAVKLARAVFFMLKNKTVFDPGRLVASLQNQFGPGCRQPARLTGSAKNAMPPQAAAPDPCASSTPVCVGQARNPADLNGTRSQRPKSTVNLKTTKRKKMDLPLKEGCRQGIPQKRERAEARPCRLSPRSRRSGRFPALPYPPTGSNKQ